MKTFRLLAIAFSILLFSNTLYAQSAKPVVEGTWKIKSLNDSGKMIDHGARETNVVIAKNNMTIHVGCNHVSTKIEFITADKIKPFDISATRKSCSEHHQNLESTLRYALEQTNSIRKNGAKIEFYKDNDLLIVLEKKTEQVKKKGR